MSHKNSPPQWKGPKNRKHRRLDGWVGALSGILLGAGLGCFVLLIPLPFPFHPALFPGESTVALVSGSSGLFLGGVRLLILWVNGQSTPRQSTQGRSEHAKAPRTRQVSQHAHPFLLMPRRTTWDELGHVPWDVLRRRLTHGRLGHRGEAASLLDAWGTMAQAPHTGTHTDSKPGVHIFALTLCGKEEQDRRSFVSVHSAMLIKSRIWLIVSFKRK